jgi:hypothetical protein
MSADPPRGGSFTPTQRPGKLTVEEFKAVSGIVRDLLADEPLIKYSIYAAGVAGALETAHLVWLFLRFLLHNL